MPLTALAFGEKSRLRALLEHFSVIEDPREPWKVAHPLPEVLLLVVCGTIADCDDYDHIAAWGEAHLPFLREMQPYHHGVPGGRWLTLRMNRIDPGLFSACFTAWVREMWPDRPDFVAIDGKTSRRSHDRSNGKAPLQLPTVERLGGSVARPRQDRTLAVHPGLAARSRPAAASKCGAEQGRGAERVGQGDVFSQTGRDARSQLRESGLSRVRTEPPGVGRNPMEHPLPSGRHRQAEV